MRYTFEMHLMRCEKYYTTADVKAVSQNVTGMMAKTYWRNINAAKRVANGRVASRNCVNSTRFCAAGMHDMVRSTNAAERSLGNHGELSARRKSNPNKHAPGRNTKRTKHAETKASMSGDSKRVR